MFRPQIARRAFSLWTRTSPTPPSSILRSAAPHELPDVSVQRVHIRRPFFSRSRLTTITFSAVSLYVVLRWLDAQVPDDEWETQHPEDLDDDEEDVLLSIPLGLSQKKEAPFYKGTDPEWQRFIALAKDPERLKGIKGRLVATVRGNFAKKSNNRRLQFTVDKLGKVDTSKGSVWLEHTFPDRPPHEYERPVLEITHDLAVRKTSVPVEPLMHQRLHNVILPKNTIWSMYTNLKIKAKIKWLTWQASRLPDDPSNPSAQRARAIAQQLNAEIYPTSQKAAETAAPVDGQTGLWQSWFRPEGFTMDLRLFNMLMRHSTVQSYQDLPPPRGSFYITGLVQVVGDKGRMTVDVKAAYDPKTEKLVRLNLSIKTLSEYTQRPKGGH